MSELNLVRQPTKIALGNIILNALKEMNNLLKLRNKSSSITMRGNKAKSDIMQEEEYFISINVNSSFYLLVLAFNQI